MMNDDGSGKDYLHSWRRWDGLEFAYALEHVKLFTVQRLQVYWDRLD